MAWLSTIRGWSATCIETFDTLIFPRRCAVCRGAARSVLLCPPCREAILANSAPSCRRCATSLTGVVALGPAASMPVGCPFCKPGRPRFDAAVALGPYLNDLRDLCLRIKHVQSAWMVSHLAELIVQAQGEWLRAWIAESVAGENLGACVVPVPLHWRRRLRRGYNQSEVLARALARRLELPCRDALVRVKATPKLHAMGRTERQAQLRGAFRARRGAWRALEARDVVLVDDVLTTGATCNAAARVLKRAGARRVVVVVIARASEYR